MNIEELRKSLIKHEAIKLKPYRCTADKLTIGVGRNLDDNGITEKEALMLLDNDIENCTKDLDRNVSGWRSHNEFRQNVLVELCFNIGINRMLGFKKMLAALQKNDYATAAVEMLDSKWAKQVGQRSATMAQMMREGK
jgi:lysozyme